MKIGRKSWVSLGIISIIVIFIIIFNIEKSKTFIYPETAFPTLFSDVTNAGIFPDDKTFPDCVPKSSSWIINSKYYWWKIFHGKEDLKQFVTRNFYMPSLYINSIKHYDDIIWHIHSVSEALIIKSSKQQLGSSLIPLPNDFIIPGGRFREIYYWDTYFTLLGYTVQHRTDVVYTITKNMAYLINKFGFMPNGNRSYYLSRSQPPFFSLIVEMNAQMMGDTMYVHFLPELEKEYTYWTENPDKQNVFKHCVKLESNEWLNRYYDNLNSPREEMYRQDIKMFEKNKSIIPDTTQFYRTIRSTAESGWDFSSRWFEGNMGVAGSVTLDILPVDLNCLLYHLEKTIAKAYHIKGDNKEKLFDSLAVSRRLNINKYFWSDSAGFYFDYNFKSKHTTGKYTLAGVFPLFMGLSDSIKAIKVSRVLREKFLKPGGVVTTLTNSGEQWDYPNGWAPLQWATIEGLLNYKYTGLADTIKNRWLQLNERYFMKTHKMIEKYNVVDSLLAPHDGEYPTQDGFGWTNGVYLNLKLSGNSNNQN